MPTLQRYEYDASGQYIVVRSNGHDQTWKLEIDAEHPCGRWRNVRSGRYATAHETRVYDRLYDNRPQF